MDSLCCYSKHDFPISVCWLPDLSQWHTAHEAHDSIWLVIKHVWNPQDVDCSLVNLRASPQEPGDDAEL